MSAAVRRVLIPPLRKPTRENGLFQGASARCRIRCAPSRVFSYYLFSGYRIQRGFCLRDLAWNSPERLLKVNLKRRRNNLSIRSSRIGLSSGGMKPVWNGISTSSLFFWDFLLPSFRYEFSNHFLLPYFLQTEDYIMEVILAQGGVYWALTIIHSVLGVQYASSLFHNFLAEHGFVQSMSRKGNCWDNAVAESFFNSLKTECIHRLESIPKFDEPRRIMFDYIKVFYIRKRRHSSLGYLSPMEYAKKIA